MKVDRDMYSPNAVDQAERKQQTVICGADKTIVGDAMVKKQAVRYSYRAVANRNDQYVLHDVLVKYIKKQLKLPWHFVYDLCPLEPRWESGCHFDVLEDPWPNTMLMVCPPAFLARAVMARAVVEYFKGKDIIFIGQDWLLDTPLERTFVRKLGIYKHLGTPVMEPYREQMKRSYAIYLFLQPETITRIDILQGRHQANPRFVTSWKNRCKLLNNPHYITKLDMAARMIWNNVLITDVR